MSVFTLEQVPLLQDLSKKELAQVAGFLIAKEYSQGDEIFFRDKIRDRVVIITSGRASIKNNINPEQTIAIFKEGDSLGELALVAKNSYHKYATVAASKSLETLELSVYNWHTIIKRNPKLAQKIYSNISQHMSERLAHANNKLVGLFTTGKIIATDNDLNSITKDVLDIILKIIPSQKALLVSLEKAAGKVHIYQSRGYTNLKNNTYYNLNEDLLLNKLSEQAQTVFINKNKCPAQYKKLLYMASSLIVVPISTVDEVIGFIILGDKSNGHNFSTNNQILLEAISSQIAPAIKQIMSSQLKTAQAEIKQIYIDPFAKT